MKNYLIIILIIGVSCKKSSDPLKKFANNSIEIKVFSSTGDSSIYFFHGANAPMYLAFNFNGTGDKFIAEGKISASVRQIIIEEALNDTNHTKISCHYFPGGTNPYSYSTEDPGVINFTTFSNNFAKGSFYAKCKARSDSILIKGTFSGYYNN